MQQLLSSLATKAAAMMKKVSFPSMLPKVMQTLAQIGLALIILLGHLPFGLHIRFILDATVVISTELWFLMDGLRSYQTAK